MINVSVSYGFGDDNRYYTENIPPSIQLALYKYENYVINSDDVFKSIEENNTKVRATHLPLDTLKLPAEKICTMINEIFEKTGCVKYVIHPNKGLTDFIDQFFFRCHSQTCLCIETFGWKSNKYLRSPLEIVEFILIYQPSLRMVIDTSHIEELWFDPKIISFLLRYTSVIHLSNRAKGHGQHLPFNSPVGNLNLVKFVKELKYRYKWDGDIVLEYMPEHQHKLNKNANYLQSLVN